MTPTKRRPEDRQSIMLSERERCIRILAISFPVNNAEWKVIAVRMRDESFGEDTENDRLRAGTLPHDPFEGAVPYVPK